MAEAWSAAAPIRTADRGSVREVNLQAILQCLREVAATTRAELVRATGLSAPTVSALVNELERAGIVGDGGVGPSTGGRRGALVALNASARVVLAVDVSTQPAQYALTDLRGEIVPRSAGTVPASAMRTPDHLVTWISSKLRSQQRIIGIGIAVPGVTDPETGFVEWAPSLEWRGADLGARLHTRSDRIVVVENDLNLATLGEYAFAPEDLGDVVMLGVRGGFGAGLIINGKLHRGAHNSAGEIGYLPYPGQPQERDFGALEAALFAELKSTPHRDHKIAELIGFACIALGAVLDINTIILGHDITTHFPDAPTLTATKLASSLVHPPRVISSALGHQASLRGAGFAVQQILSTDIRRVLL
jgi:DNA-binding Lrp family transcriptional regulator